MIVTLATLTALSLMAAYTLQRVGPKFRTAYQNAAWQEARVAAEAGIDAAMGDLLRNSTGPAPGTWQGWKQNNGGIIGPVLSNPLGLITNLLTALLGGGGSATTTTTTSDPIFLDNLRVSAASGVPTEVDVQLWALPAVASSQRGWFRIRSMATCALPPAAYELPGNLEAPLRRFSLRKMRPQLRRNDVGDPMTIPTPNVSRTVEVLVEPILPFELALWTDKSLSLGTSGSWRVDSYDSRDPEKSKPDGTYPGEGSPKVQHNGNVASNRGRPGDSLYGPLIAANGTRVFGSVATNGGDNPDTEARENVSGSIAIDPAKIRDDFCREMKPVARPAESDAVLSSGSAFAPGTESEPAKYLIDGDLGGFSVAAAPEGTRGVAIIMVNGDLDVRSGAISIPQNVTVVLYVRGNIDFNKRLINAWSTSSRRPGQLQIYGEDSGNQRRTLRAHGSALIYAAFYGPTYDVSLADNVTWHGAIGARSFEMIGGGDGGFHYDEALAVLGPPVSFRIARYVEDVRE